jgi:hypothetical protein
LAIRTVYEKSQRPFSGSDRSGRNALRTLTRMPSVNAEDTPTP